MKNLKWYHFFAAAVIFGEALVFLVLGKRSYIAVHDNLDLFVAHFKMLKDGHAFFAQNASLPLLGGISRDYFASEFSLYNLLYLVLPPYAAYIAGYILKIPLGIFSFTLLLREFLKESYARYAGFSFLCALAFGLLAVFPAYSFAFTSLPLIVWLFCRIYRQPAKRYYALLFCYPLLSYFSYFGLFILGYAAIALLVLWIKDKRFPRSLFFGIFVLFFGYAVFEYRLFLQMLFHDTPTIRQTMAMASLTAPEIAAWIWDAFKNGIFHADSAHGKWVLPLCALYFTVHTARMLFARLHAKNSPVAAQPPKRTLPVAFALLLLFILFNCAIYGLYYQETFRGIVETLLPPLKGWQFNRTVFFNPFLWYAAFFLVLKAAYDGAAGHPCVLVQKYAKLPAYAAVLISIFIITITPARYNDFYNTCYFKAYELIRHAKPNALSYEEFYSEDLFAAIKSDIGYQGEKCAAYGLHPAVLEYNGILTLDGYLGFYPLAYKEEFRKIVAPALERSTAWRINFDNWGARAYLFPGNDADNSWQPVRNYTLLDDKLYINADAFRALGGQYIFSRFALSNADALPLSLVRVYSKEGSPYAIYLYKAADTAGI